MEEKDKLLKEKTSYRKRIELEKIDKQIDAIESDS